jgi:hypothetical protein
MAIKGTEITVESKKRGLKAQMFVAEIDYERGITIKHLDENFLNGVDLCLSIDGYFKNPDMNRKPWENHFKYWMNAIQCGFLDMDEYHENFCSGDKVQRPQSCAFEG